MKILFVTTILARKKQLGGEISTQAFIDALGSNGHEVSVLGYCRKGQAFEKNKQEILIGERYIETANAQKLYPAFWLFISLIKGLPYSAAKYYSLDYIKTVKELLATKDYDVVVVDHSRLEWLQPFIDSQYKLVLIAHNVEHEIYEESFKTARNLIAKWIYKREAQLTKEMQDRLSSAVQEVWAYTEHDAKYFRGIKIFQQRI
jgi:polysaccharide biosynthesis protein PslH